MWLNPTPAKAEAKGKEKVRNISGVYPAYIYRFASPLVLPLCNLKLNMADNLMVCADATLCIICV